MCSAFVRRSLFVGGVTGFGEPNAAAFTNGPDQMGKATLRVVYKMEGKDGASVSLGEQEIANFETTFEIRKPRMGDIISYGYGGSDPNTSHVGIYLGHGLFLNATTTFSPNAVGHQIPVNPDQSRFEPEGSVMIKFVPSDIDPAKKIIFRGVEP